MFVYGVSTGVEAQFDSAFVKTNLKRCADSLTFAFKSNDWEMFTRYSYPAMIGSLGGKKAFTDYISNTFSQLPDSAWKKYETGKIVQLEKQGKDFQGIIELNTIVEWQDRRVTTTSHLIGESWDGGLFWTFFDSQGDEQAARHINPSLSPAIKIPGRVEENISLLKPKTTPKK